MTDRNRGGRIAPDGRAPQAPGVGKNAKRHDLERPATPGLHDSDLQQGDVQALEQGQRIAPIRQQRASTGASGTRTSSNGGSNRQSQRVAPSGTPDPIEFAAGRFGGQLSEPGATRATVDPTPWLPLLRQMATNGSGLLTSAYITRAAGLVRRPVNPGVSVTDMGEFKRALGESVDQ